MTGRKAVPDPQADALASATEQLEVAKAAWTEAIYAALDTGASYREIATLAGVSHGTIETIARRRT